MTGISGRGSEAGLRLSEYVTLHGRECLVYSLGGHLDRIVYVTLLTPAHYLQVAFDFVDNSRGYETTWRSEAQSIADSIAASLEVREAQ
jgi:hypothetical protein